MKAVEVKKKNRERTVQIAVHCEPTCVKFELGSVSQYDTGESTYLRRFLSTFLCMLTKKVRRTKTKTSNLALSVTSMKNLLAAPGRYVLFKLVAKGQHQIVEKLLW